MENNMLAFLKRASERIGFQRDRFLEKNIPTTTSNIVVIPFFGDIRSVAILSAYLLKQYKEYRSSKYIILASWPGMQALFPYVDEYWSIKDSSVLISLASGANNFYNQADAETNINRSFIEHFENVITSKDLKTFYNDNFESKYWECLAEKKSLFRFFPEVHSSNKLNEDFKFQLNRATGTKIIVYPNKNMRSWEQGKMQYLPCPREFWLKLTERLLLEGFTPVVYQNNFTYDISTEFTDRCLYLVSKDVADVLCAMRAVGCVLDVYSGISKLAIAARCPFVAVDQRIRFINQKDYELDDLSIVVPKQYIFSFSTMLLSGRVDDWNNSLLDNIIIRLKKFLPSLNRDEWATTTESYDSVSFDVVRQRKQKRLGVRFIRKY